MIFEFIKSNILIGALSATVDITELSSLAQLFISSGNIYEYNKIKLFFLF